ncbi:MAG: YceD family protein [Terriglobales bacterium]
MLIALEELAHGPVTLERDFAPGELEVRHPDLDQPGAVHARAEARLAGQELRVHLQWTAAESLLCARCLQPLPSRYSGDADLVYHPAGEWSPEHAVKIHDADTEIDFYRPPGLEFEDVLREQILLTLPMRVLCREDCAGLCPRCGHNRNAGPCACAPAAAQ